MGLLTDDDYNNYIKYVQSIEAGNAPWESGSFGATYTNPQSYGQWLASDTNPAEPTKPTEIPYEPTVSGYEWAGEDKSGWEASNTKKQADYQLALDEYNTKYPTISPEDKITNPRDLDIFKNLPYTTTAALGMAIRDYKRGYKTVPKTETFSSGDAETPPDFADTRNFWGSLKAGDKVEIDKYGWYQIPKDADQKNLRVPVGSWVNVFTGKYQPAWMDAPTTADQGRDMNYTGESTGLKGFMETVAPYIDDLIVALGTYGLGGVETAAEAGAAASAAQSAAQTGTSLAQSVGSWFANPSNISALGQGLVKGGLTWAKTGDLGKGALEGLTSAATSYAGSYLGDFISGGGYIDPSTLSPSAVKGLTTGLLGAGISGLKGDDLTTALMNGLVSGTLAYVGGKWVDKKTGKNLDLSKYGVTSGTYQGDDSYWDQWGGIGDPTYQIAPSDISAPYATNSIIESPVDMGQVSRAWEMLGGRGAYGYDPNIGDPTAMIEPTSTGLYSPTTDPFSYFNSPYWRDANKTFGDPTAQIEVPPGYMGEDYNAFINRLGLTDQIVDPFVDIQRPQNYAAYLGEYRNLGERPWEEDPTRPAIQGMDTWSYSGPGPGAGSQIPDTGKGIKPSDIATAITTALGGGSVPGGGSGGSGGAGGSSSSGKGLLSIEDMPIPEYMKKKLKKKVKETGKTWEEYMTATMKNQKGYYSLEELLSNHYA
jgi:hypothetical protein